MKPKNGKFDKVVLIGPVVLVRELTKNDIRMATAHSARTGYASQNNIARGK